MANNEVVTILKGITEKATTWIQNETKLTVTTNFMVPNDKTTALTVKTELTFSGDLSTDVPSKRVKEDLVINTELQALHQANVKMAMDYRNQLLNSVLQALKDL